MAKHEEVLGHPVVERLGLGVTVLNQCAQLSCKFMERTCS